MVESDMHYAVLEILKGSGYSVDSVCSDENGRSHKITFSGPSDNEGQIYTKDGQVMWISGQ